MSLSKDIDRTINYANFFGYSPSLKEIHRWLISPHIYSYRQVASFFKKRPPRSANFIVSKQKISHAQRMANTLSWFPGIKMIALSGSVAAHNAKPQDDIDLFIVTRHHTLWIVRPFFLLLLSLFFKKRKRGDPHQNLRDVFCPNLWLDESILTIEAQNLYTAHEVLQIIPLLNKDHTYEKFITKNSWTKNYLANAYHLTTHASDFSTCRGVARRAHIPIKILNHFFYLLQRLYMSPYHTTEKISLHSAFLHTRDYSHLK